jgi:heterodisulfide reductase subunit A
MDQKPEEVEIEVGTITVATGNDMYDPSDDPRYGYGKFQNVITALEAERLINAAGPTGGHVIRASDGKTPKRVAFIQCVGSRDINKFEYCTGFCCMYAIKEAILIKEHEHDTEIYIHYIDMRTPFKGFEDFYRRARDLGITFIRGKPSEIIEDPKTNNLSIRTVDADLGAPLEVEADLVILCNAAIPSAGSDDLSRILHVTRGSDGFFLESHAIETDRYSGRRHLLSRICQGPKDIPYSVCQGSGSAGRAATILSKQNGKLNHCCNRRP